jgi:AcrR family transcriptional regulator
VTAGTWKRVPKRAIHAAMPRPPQPHAHDQARVQQRAAILGVARQLFGEMGYERATLRDIIRRTSLPAGKVQQLFPDKDAIFHTLVEDSSRRLRARVRAARDRATSLAEFVAGPYRALFTFAAEDRVTFDLLRREPATIRALLEEPALGASIAELREDLEAAVARGDMPQVDLDYLTAAMAGVAVEVALRMVERQPADVEGATAFVTRLFLGGLDALRDSPRPRRGAGRRQARAPRGRPSR